MVGVANGVSPEEAAAAWTKMATRPAEESGTPKPEPTIATMQAELRMAKITIDSLTAQLKTNEGKLDEAFREIAELSAKLAVASGVTEAARSIETIAKLQKSDIVQRRHMDALSKERDYLVRLCAQAGIKHDEAEVFAEIVEPTAGSLGLTGTPDREDPSE